MQPTPWAVPTAPGYSMPPAYHPGYAQPAQPPMTHPGYAQPAMAHPAYAAPSSPPPGYAQPMEYAPQPQSGSAQPMGYAPQPQPGYAQPAAAQPAPQDVQPEPAKKGKKDKKNKRGAKSENPSTATPTAAESVSKVSNMAQNIFLVVSLFVFLAALIFSAIDAEYTPGSSNPGTVVLCEVTFASSIEEYASFKVVIKAEKDKILTEHDAPTLEGYIFVAWYKDADFETLWDFETDTVEANMTLYAKWEKDE